jgi:hypothetical protein
MIAQQVMVQAMSWGKEEGRPGDNKNVAEGEGPSATKQLLGALRRMAQG